MALWSLHAEVQDCSWAKLNPISDFLQHIVVRAAAFRPPQSKSYSLQLETPLSLHCCGPSEIPAARQAQRELY
jgi:hypothetical protein